MRAFGSRGLASSYGGVRNSWDDFKGRQRHSAHIPQNRPVDNRVPDQREISHFSGEACHDILHGTAEKVVNR